MPTKTKPPPKGLRNRVIERRKVRGADLGRNPKNYREHSPEQSEALRAVLEEIGPAGELLAWYSERDGGKLTLINGHLRSGDYPDELWDVAITDLTDAEADKLLAVLDPLAAAAEVNEEKLRALLAEFPRKYEVSQTLALLTLPNARTSCWGVRVERVYTVYVYETPNPV